MPGRLTLVVNALAVLLSVAAPAQEYTFERYAGRDGGLGWYDGSGSAARFSYIGAIAVDTSGNVLLSDSPNHLIRRVTPAGEVSTVSGQLFVTGRVDGSAATASFDSPTGVTVDGSGNVYVMSGTLLQSIVDLPALSNTSYQINGPR
jgi:hypothetical protein